MNRVQKILTLAVCVFLAGCTPSEILSSNTHLSTPFVPSSSATMEITHPGVILNPTMTDSSSTATTPTVGGVVSKHKVTIDSTVPSQPGGEGILVVRYRDQPQLNLLTLDTMVTEPLQGENLYLENPLIFSISPDLTKLAYMNQTDDTQTELRIISGSAFERSVPNWPDGVYWSIIKWLDDQRLALAELDHRDGAVFVHDLTVGETTELIPFFPAVTEKGKLFLDLWMVVPYVYYDPSLTRVVIVRQPDIIPYQTPQLNYELWDITTKELLWEGVGTMASSRRPVWSPSGYMFAIILDPYPPQENDYCGKLFLIDLDGEQTQIDDCATVSTSWSPDGRYLATWHVSSGNLCPANFDSNELHVLEIATGNRDIYTLCSGPGEGGISHSQYPIWSPNNIFIAFNRYNVHEMSINSVILDLTKAEAYVLPEIAEVRGWMRTEP